MVFTPLDIQNKEFAKSWRGYNQGEVDVFLSRILKDYEQIYKELQQAKEESKLLKKELDSYRDLENTLKNTLLLAQQKSEEIKECTQKECDLMLKENELKIEAELLESQKRLNEVQEEFALWSNKLNNFKIQLKSFLQSQLELVETMDFKD